jgi:hypothetical protein
MQHRKNSWVDGMAGTQCPILPGTNFTYKWQLKDQIGSFFYFPSLGMQRARRAGTAPSAWSAASSSRSPSTRPPTTTSS